jgi:DNA-binding NtrC family response regulator
METEGKGRVLVLAEDEILAGWLRRVVSAAGHDVRTARSVSELLELLDESDPEVVVADAGSPAASVLELQVALARGKGELPIIFLATPSVESGVRALLSGGFRHLFKPVPVRVMQETVLEALIARRLGRPGGSWRGANGFVSGTRLTRPVPTAELDAIALEAVAARGEPDGAKARARRTPDPDREAR